MDQWRHNRLECNPNQPNQQDDHRERNTSIFSVCFRSQYRNLFECTKFMNNYESRVLFDVVGNYNLMDGFIPMV